MTLEILPDAADTTQFRVSTGQLPRGIACIVSNGAGLAPMKPALHFSYDYSGTAGSYPATITITKGDSSKQFSFRIIVPDTVSNGWVFAGHKSGPVFAYQIYDPANRQNSLYATTRDLATDPRDTVLHFKFDYRLWPLPTKDTNLLLSGNDPSLYAGVFSFELHDYGVPMNPFTHYWHLSQTNHRIRYFYNGGKPRVKATGIVIQYDPNDTLSRRIISFDLRAR